MDQKKDLTLLSCVDEEVSLRFKEDQESIQVDVEHLLKPYQKTTETVMEGIPNAIETTVPENAQHSNVYYQGEEINKITQSVPPLGKTFPVDDNAEDEKKEDSKQKDVLVDVGSHAGPDSSGVQHFSKGFLWKALSSLLFVISAVTLLLWIGNAFHTEVYRVQKRSSKDEIRINKYKILDPGANCSMGIKLIQAECKKLEQAICVRDADWKNLVVACTVNMSMYEYCPVFTVARNNQTKQFLTIHADRHSSCNTCGHYQLWNVGEFPECLKLELDGSTTASSSNAQPNSAEKDADEGLSSGGIAGIVIGLLLGIVLVILLILHKSGQLNIMKEEICKVWGQVQGRILVKQNETEVPKNDQKLT